MLVGGEGQSQECSVYAEEVRVKRMKQAASIGVSLRAPWSLTNEVDERLGG